MQTYEHVYALNNVQEHLVLSISDTLRSPRHRIRDSHRRSRLNFKFMTLLGDVSNVSRVHTDTTYS